MFAMQGNPYLNTPLHRAKGIKKLILIQAVFDVLDGALPRDFTAGWIGLSLAVDRIYPLGGFRSGSGVSICLCPFACTGYSHVCVDIIGKRLPRFIIIILLFSCLS